MTEDLYREAFAGFDIQNMSDKKYVFNSDGKKQQNDPVMKEGQEGFK